MRRPTSASAMTAPKPHPKSKSATACAGALLILLTPALLCACGRSTAPSSSQPGDASVAARELPDSSPSDPDNPPTPSGGVPESPPVSGPTYQVDALIYNGTGVSTSDWQSTEQIVKSQGFSYQLANASQLNAMSLDQIASFGVLIVPGGSGGTIYGNVAPDTRLRIRQAVRERGMGYVGFCAGAWVAVGPEASTAKTASYGFAVAEGDVLPAYFPGGNTSLTAAIVDVTFADHSHRSMVWWGGPSTPEWANGVVARYENGKPVISETASGNGYVVISGTHPEAPPGWRATAGNDPDGLDYDIAIAMIRAALTHVPMPVLGAEISP